MPPSRKSRRKQNSGTKDTPDTPPKQKAGVLTGQEIAELEIVQNAAKDYLRAASCNLQLGPKVFVCGTGTTDYLDLDPANPSRAGVTIPPFGTILFSTVETICTPHNVIGRFDLKIKLGLAGLILQVGPQVEPGYEGPLFGMILNAGSRPKTISCNESFLTIEFSYTSEQPDEKLLEESKDTIESLPAFINKSNVDLDRLKEKSIIERVREEFDLSRKRKVTTMMSRRETVLFIVAVVSAPVAIVSAVIAALSYARSRQIETADPGDRPPEEDRPTTPGKSEQEEDPDSNQLIGRIR